MTKRIHEAGEALPQKSFKASTVQLFLYNAAIWNSHRIHYDLPYAQQEEGHAQLLVDGPLQGDWLSQLVYEWLGDDGVLTQFSYSNRRAAYVGETLTAAGDVRTSDGESLTLALSLTNERDELVTMATAQVQLQTSR